MLLGCDISNYQAGVPGGYDFYIIKASEGNGYKSPSLDNQFNEVKANGKLYGFYHYARPDLGNTPEAEADWFLSLVGQHAGNAIFALDWEGASLGYPVDWALRWLKRVQEKTGVKPVFYCSQSPVQTGKFKPIADADFGLWVAQYNGKSTPDVTSASGWNAWAFWQWTSSPIDKDYFNGDTATYKKYCAKAGTTTEPAKPAKKSIAEIVKEVIAGKWGTGIERKKKLEAAGYNYAEVQAQVNKSLAPKYKKATYAVALDVLENKYGTGVSRETKLEQAGYKPEEVQKLVNNLIDVANETIRGDFGNEPQRSATLRRLGWNPEIVQAAVNIRLK